MKISSFSFFAVASLTFVAAQGAEGYGHERASMAPVRAITRGPQFHWFGYYDKLQFDPSGRYVLGMRVEFENRNPTPDDVVRIGMVDLEDGDRWIELGESRAWCWQQGCHLQWRPGSDREVIWNDRQDGRFVAVVLDVKTGRRRLLPRPVDNLSPDGKWALGVDFARIRDFRAGYGYAGVTDPDRGVATPEASGVYRMDLDTGESRLLVSSAQAAAIGPQHPSIAAGARRYINHVQWSPDGRRFLFLERPATRLMTAASDGSDLRVVMFDASHYTWRDPRSICVWTGDGYRLYADEPLAEGELLWSAVNGHQTYFPDRDWLLTDTYPDARRMQTLYLFNLPTARRNALGEFHSPPDYRGDWRADLHPRLSPDARWVCFDSTHEGGRQMYLMDIRGIGPQPPGRERDPMSTEPAGTGARRVDSIRSRDFARLGPLRRSALWVQRLPAEAFAGGLGGRTFQPQEALGAFGDMPDRINRGQSLPVITLAGKGAVGNTVTADFEVDSSLLGSASHHATHELWLRGQWNHQGDLRYEDHKLGQQMPTFGYFRILLNDLAVFEGAIYFWNYRQWRFWPRFEIPLPDGLLRPGLNRLTIVNQTPPFHEGVPDLVKSHCLSASDPGSAVRSEILTDTAFHLHDVVLASDVAPDLGLAASPSLVRTGDAFVLALGSTRERAVGLESDGGRWEHPARLLLRRGLNLLPMRALRAGPSGELRVVPADQAAITHALPPAVEVPADGLHFGHLIGGHLSARTDPMDYSHRVRRLFQEEQGNLIAFNTDFCLAHDRISAPTIEGAPLDAAGIRVVLRGGGDAPGLGKLIRGLGSSLLAAAPHEVSHANVNGFGRRDSRDLIQDSLKLTARTVIDRWRAILPSGAKVFVTDPSFYGPMFLAAGADQVGVETFMLPGQLLGAAARGTARMHAQRGWAAINSFECQAPGGLDSWAHDGRPEHAARRRLLWRISQFDLLLGGARTIYSESGFPDQVVGRQFGLESADGQEFAAAQREVWAFARMQGLQGQPQVCCAFLRRADDAFLSNYGPRYADQVEPADAAWEQLRAVWPELSWGKNRLDRLCPEVKRSATWSSAPGGEADIIPLPATAAQLGTYRAVVTTGDCRLDRAALRLLEEYARAGGQCLVVTADVSHSARDALAGWRAVADQVESALWRRSVGQGATWLLDMTDHQYSAAYARWRLRAVERVLIDAPPPLTIEGDNRVHHYVYPISDEANGFCAILLNHDWQSGREEVVNCRAGELSFSVTVPAGEVRLAWCLPEAVLLPDHPLVRIDRVLRPEAGLVHLGLQGIGSTRIRARFVNLPSEVELEIPGGGAFTVEADVGRRMLRLAPQRRSP